jgi:hypothetical protein
MKRLIRAPFWATLAIAAGFFLGGVTFTFIALTGIHI